MKIYQLMYISIRGIIGNMVEDSFALFAWLRFLLGITILIAIVNHL
jgi:undecaprenyl pyrophosphate phosphatase UppP